MYKFLTKEHAFSSHFFKSCRHKELTYFAKDRLLCKSPNLNSWTSQWAKILQAYQILLNALQLVNAFKMIAALLLLTMEHFRINYALVRIHLNFTKIKGMKFLALIRINMQAIILLGKFNYQIVLQLIAALQVYAAQM